MKKLLALTSIAGLLFLAACSSNANAGQTSDATGAPQANAADANNNGFGQGRGMYQQNLQQYADEANTASDKTSLTKDQFTTELQTLLQAQRAKFQQNGGQNGSGSGRMMYGQRFGSGGFMGQRTGSGARMGMQSRLATATTFYKYTDPNGNEALIALDANGQVVFHWPMPFGRRGMNGGQMPMGNQQPLQQ